MGRLLVAMLNEGKTVTGTQFLTPELIREAIRGQAEAESELGGPTRYGLGWEVDSAFGTLTVKKAGSVHSMVSLWVILPERRVAVAFAFNREDYQIVPVVPTVLSVIGGGPTALLPAASWPAAPPIATRAVAPAVLDRWLGVYDTRFGDVTVYRRGDSLFSDYDGAEGPLLPTSDSTFALGDDLVAHTGKVVGFRRSGAGVTIWLGADSLGLRTPR
jgi:hypothetical protein